jgi:hypothetical protein
MIITEKGYLGLAACTSKEGDQLAICKGSSVPLILRMAEHRDRGSLVGDAYVHDIMKGEIFEEKNCRPLIIS